MVLNYFFIHYIYIKDKVIPYEGYAVLVTYYNQFIHLIKQNYEINYEINKEN